MYFKRCNHIIGCFKSVLEFIICTVYVNCELNVLNKSKIDLIVSSVKKLSSLTEDPHSYVLDRGFLSLKLAEEKFVASSICVGNFKLLGED